MPIFAKIRVYHVGLLTLTALTYLTGELGEVHEWLGYGVTGIIALRVLWGLVGPRQVGISRFFPHLDELRQSRLSDPAVSRLLISIVAALLIATTATGILLEEPADQTVPAFQSSTASPAPRAGIAEKTGFVVSASRADDSHEGSKEGWLEEVHELAANLLVLAVAAHVLYLFVFKRELALYMLFVREPKRG
jgi:cytochrome b